MQLLDKLRTLAGPSRRWWGEIIVPGFALGALLFLPTVIGAFVVFKFPFDEAWSLGWMCLLVSYAAVIAWRYVRRPRKET